MLLHTRQKRVEIDKCEYTESKLGTKLVLFTTGTCVGQAKRL